MTAWQEISEDLGKLVVALLKYGMVAGLLLGAFYLIAP
jgi:hypothetical protein